MNTSIDFLCDLWIALSQFVNCEYVDDKDCSDLVDIMSIVEKAFDFKTSR